MLHLVGCRSKVVCQILLEIFCVPMELTIAPSFNLVQSLLARRLEYGQGLLDLSNPCSIFGFALLFDLCLVLPQLLSR